jgi:hypothetical protein
MLLTYIDPSEEMKPQPVAISIGQGNKGKLPDSFGSYGDFLVSLSIKKAERLSLNQ